jgi:hypothetical protein
MRRDALLDDRSGWLDESVIDSVTIWWWWEEGLVTIGRTESRALAVSLFARLVVCSSAALRSAAHFFLSLSLACVTLPQGKRQKKGHPGLRAFRTLSCLLARVQL